MKFKKVPNVCFFSKYTREDGKYTIESKDRKINGTLKNVFIVTDNNDNEVAVFNRLKEADESRVTRSMARGSFLGKATDLLQRRSSSRMAGEIRKGKEAPERTAAENQLNDAEPGGQTRQKGWNIMFRLYTAENNAMNFLILYDVDNDRSAILDWDLTASQILKYAFMFEAGKLTTQEMCLIYAWEHGQNAFSGLFNIQEL